MLRWHLLEDLFGWIIVLIGAGLIAWTGWTWIDPLLAIGLSLFILWNVLKGLKETLYLLSQGRPRDFHSPDFKKQVAAIDGIVDVDSVRVWSLDGVDNVMSIRIHIHAVEDRSEIERIKRDVRHIASHFSIHERFVTIETCLGQIETCLAQENC